MSEIAVSCVPHYMQPLPTAEKNAASTTSAGSERIDLSKGAIEFQLVAISSAFTKALAEMIATGVKEQKVIEGRLKTLSAVLNALQKLQQTAFSRADLDKTQDISLPPSELRRMLAVSKVRARLQRDQDKQAAKDAVTRLCARVMQDEWNNVPAFRPGYLDMMKGIKTVEDVTVSPNGVLRYWGYDEKGEWVYHDVPVTRTDASRLKAADSVKDAAFSKAEKDYRAATSSDALTMGNLLYGLNIYTENEKLPTTKEELKIAATKISDMISGLQTTQSTLVANTDGINNNRAQELAKNAERVSGFIKSMKQLIDSM